MRTIALMSLLLIAALSVSGCLFVERMAYDIHLDTDTTGTATINFYDIRSDAIGNKEFDEDKQLLFDFLYMGFDFVEQMQAEGKDIDNRKLYVEDDQLNGEVHFDFDDVEGLEGIRYDEGFYYLTLEVIDSIYATNGQVFVDEDYKRILWDSTMTNLQFTLYSDNTEVRSRPLVPEYEKLFKE